ncbi:MAG: spirocyclase AveC family protein [Solirubrobacteraceae bacterium]
MATVDRPARHIDPQTPAASTPQRRSGTVGWWAAFGAVGIAVALETWVRWITSSDFTKPNPGPDHYRSMTYLTIFEIASCTLAALFLWRLVIRPWIRERRMPLDGKILIGLTLSYFVDPILNLYSPTFAMNAHSVSFGSWANQLPFYTAPHQDRFAEGLLWAPELYMYFGLLAAIAGCWLLDRMRARFPRASTATLYTVLFAIFVCADFPAEWFAIVRPQIYVFAGVPKDFSLFAGTLHQFPIYQSLFAAVFAIMITWLRDSKDTHGRTAVERGLDTLSISNARKGLLSFLAVTGFMLACVLGYFLPYSWAATSADTYVRLPSYLSTAAYCGTPGTPSCSSQTITPRTSTPNPNP